MFENPKTPICAVVLGLILIAFIGTGEAQEPESKDGAKVVLRQTFPIRAVCTVGDKSIEIEDKDHVFVPAGEVSVQPTPRFGDSYSRMFMKYKLNGKLGELTTKGWEGTLKKGDVLEVVLVTVSAKPYSALVPFKDGLILVEVVHPHAFPNPEGFKGPEEYRSSAMFVAKYGYRKVAEQLAKDAIGEFAAFKPNQARMRNKQQLTVIFPMVGGKMLPGQAGGSLEELSDAIEVALRTISQQNLDGNTTFSEQVQLAEKMLKKS